MAAKISSGSKNHKSKEFMVRNPCVDDDTFDIRGVKVISKNDWNRLQYRLHQNEYEAEKERLEKEKKEQIRQCSQDTVKNWTNTVLKGSGARQKKLEERRLRLEAEEKERQKLDLAEAEFQAQKRRKAIEEAKTKQYYQTDRVKNFHSALLYSEVMKEREAQIELKRLKELSECNKDDEFVSKAKREYEEALRADQERTAKKISNTQENTNFIKSQIKHNQKQKENEMTEWLTEGENIRRLAVAHALEKQRLDQIEREEQRLIRNDIVQQIDDVNRMRDIDRLRNEEDDEEIRIFAAAKKKMLKLRLEKEREMHDEKQTHLEKIKDKLSTQLRLKMDDEDQRIKNAIMEKEEKFNSDEVEKGRHRAETLAAIEAHRQESLDRIERERRERRQRDIDSLEARRQADAVLRENEARRQELRLLEAKRLAKEHLETAKMQKEGNEFSRENQLKIQEENQKLLDLEESVFQDYARSVIAHCERGGRNTYPLRAAANRGIGGGVGPILPGAGGALRPSYRTADGKDTELAHNPAPARVDICAGAVADNSDKNLGFVWTDSPK